MSMRASQITSLTIVYLTVYTSADQGKHQSSASLAFVRGIHRSPVNSPHKWPVTRKMFPFDDVIMDIKMRLGNRAVETSVKFQKNMWTWSSFISCPFVGWLMFRVLLNKCNPNQSCPFVPLLCDNSSPQNVMHGAFAAYDIHLVWQVFFSWQIWWCYIVCNLIL